MKALRFAGIVSIGLVGMLLFAGNVQAESTATFDWTTVVNNNDFMPTRGCEQDPEKCRLFNSYNPPSVNEDGLVVFRARSRGGQGETNGHNGAGEGDVTSSAVEAGDGGQNGNGGSGTEHGNQPVHGIYTRDMSVYGSPIIRILDRKTEVPDPNNLGTTFVETPSFPRIDKNSATIATRGNHQPVWRYGEEGDETRAGTTGIYTNPFGELITGASKLGLIEDFYVYEVPSPEWPNTPFEVFPGAPSVADGNTIVFKGNYTDDEGESRTGVYFRLLADDLLGGSLATELIANSKDTFIPGTDEKVVFGSTSPPSAADGKVVFAGFDNEEEPTLGGLYMAPLEQEPTLTPLVEIGEQVPGELPSATFNGLGEGGAFDGRLVGFWGAWGDETKTLRLYCPTEGNRDRIDYCNQNLVCNGTGVIEKDENMDGPDDNGFYYKDMPVPVNQGVFVHDTRTGRTWAIAKTNEDFDDFLFWNYSGRTPCTGKGHGGEGDEGGEEDGEFVRWRSSAFLAVAGQGREGAAYRVVFKARTGDLVDNVYAEPVDGIYLQRGPGRGLPIITVLDTTMDGQSLDPDAPDDSVISELGLEREGLRGKWLTVNAKIGVEGGSEEDGMAGIYQTKIR
jgi:hypothetical protein